MFSFSYDAIDEFPETAAAVAVTPDGRVVVAGHVEREQGSVAAVAILDPDGTFDLEFGNLGRWLFDFNLPGGDNQIRDIDVQGDGRVVVAGFAGPDILLANTDPAVAGVPASVVMVAGTVSAQIPVAAIAAGTAQITASVNGTSAASVVEVTPPPPFVTAITPAALSLAKGTPGVLRVAVSRAPSAATPVALLSSDPAVASVPPQVNIPAGALFAVFSFCGIPVRIFWGALAERVLSSRAILILTGCLMAAGFALTASFTREWPVWALGLVTALLGLSANGWVGLFFAEIVRLAPEDMAGDASGGGQFFAYGGIMSMPLAFGAIVAATGSYAVGFAILTALSLTAAGLLAYGR